MEQGNQPKPSGRGPVNGHYRKMMSALAVAMSKCVVWRETESGTPFTAKELYEFCLKHDEQKPLRPEQFYMVSREGAIGISPGLEWMTTWMFLPMEPCKERDFAFRNMMEELHTESEVEKAIEQAVTEGLAREKAAKELVAAQPAPQPVAQSVEVEPTPTPAVEPAPAQAFIFCPYCGTKLPAGSKFCSECGNNLENI